MARTKQTARKATGIAVNPAAPKIRRRDRSTLMQLMGFPAVRGDDDDGVHAKTVQPDWPAVIQRLESHPDEAFTTEEPLRWALANERYPVTKEVVDAFIKAAPEMVTKPRSAALVEAYKNPNLPKEILDILTRRNPFFLVGPERTRTFQLMEFPANIQERPPHRHQYHHGASDRRAAGYPPDLPPEHVLPPNPYCMDWIALEEHLQAHPEEAKIINPAGIDGGFLFPLEAALQFQYPTPIPYSTVELLLQLCPEAVTSNDSSALYEACSSARQQDPRVIRAILQADPASADSIPPCLHSNNRQGLPISYAVRLPCAAQVIPDLVRANPKSLFIENIVGDLPLEIATDCRDPPTELVRVLLEEGHRYKELAPGEGGGQVLHVSEYGDAGSTALGHVKFMASGHQEHWQGVGQQHPCWENFCLCLQAAGAFRTGLSSVEEMWDYPLLHAVIEFDTGFWGPFDKIFGESHTDDLIRRDALGRTPLHVAIERAGKVSDDGRVNKRQRKRGGSGKDDDDYIRMDMVIQRLLHDPQHGVAQSASIPTDNRSTLPLHYALKAGLNLDHGGVGPILNSFPEAIAIPDPETNLIPCLLSATVRGNRAPTVGTIFHLMIERPNLIADLCTSSILEP